MKYNRRHITAIERAAGYTQAEAPDPNWICPDRPRRKVLTSRPSQTQSAYIQTVPDGKRICPDYRAFKTFRAFFVRSKANLYRPSQTEAVYVQTFVCSCPDHRALQIKFVRSTPKFKCVHVQTIVRSCPDQKKTTSSGAVLFLEDEEREGSKIPQIQIYKVYQKICF